MPIDLQELLDNSNTSVSTLNDIAKDPFSSEITLIKLLKRENIEQEVIKNIANNPGATSRVLKRLVDHVFSTNPRENVEILIAVLDNPNIKLNIFEAIFEYCFIHFMDEKFLIKIVKHKLAADIPSIYESILSCNGYIDMSNLVMEILKISGNNESILNKLLNKSILNKLLLEKNSLDIQEILNALLQNEMAPAFILRNINCTEIDRKILIKLLQNPNISTKELTVILNTISSLALFHDEVGLDNEKIYENQAFSLLLNIILHRNADKTITDHILKFGINNIYILKKHFNHLQRCNLAIDYIINLPGNIKNKSLNIPIELIHYIVSFVLGVDEFELRVKSIAYPIQNPFALVSFSDHLNNISASIEEHKKIKSNQIQQTIEQDLPNLCWKSEEEINACFLENGFERIKVPGDGNCFYHAIRLFLHADENYTVEDLRNLVADYIEDQVVNHNNETFRYAILAENHTIDSYISAVRQSKKNILWADNIQIAALRRILNRPIYFFNNNATPYEIADIEDENLNGDPIFIHYDGINHYDCLIPDLQHLPAIPKKLKM